MPETYLEWPSHIIQGGIVRQTFVQGDEAAMMYHDMYVNENVHLAQTFKLIRETGVLAGLEDDAYRIVRAVMIDMVLKVSHLPLAFQGTLPAERP